MDFNTGRAAFKHNSNCIPLRKPHINISQGTEMTSPTTPPIKSSGVLSPNAPEFVPQNYIPISLSAIRTPNRVIEDLPANFNAMKVASVQNRLNVRQSPQEAAPSNPFVNHYEHYNILPEQNQQNRVENATGVNITPDNRHQQINAAQPNSFQETSEMANEETFAINYIQTIVKCLNDNPGSFDSIAARALSMFEGFGENHYVLSNAMEIIFNKSIDEQNFRYMGAKLYNLLDLIDLRKDSVFRNLLNLKLTYHQTEVLKYMQNEQFKVRGTTLFLAELYMQLRNDGCQIKDIAQNIVFSIKQLLQKITPENIKCICLTLKLAGYDLEKDCPKDIQEIILILNTVKALDVSTSRILETVLNLQKNRWGRNVEPLDHTHNLDTIRNTDEPVFYGPDGQILTEEENFFLESNILDDENNGEEIDSDIELDPEMDAETELAYKDFLKKQC